MIPRLVALALVVASSTTALAQTPGPAGTVRYYHTDALGSVRAVTDAQGEVIARHDYFAFGEEPAHAPNPAPQRFTGQQRDPESGMDYFQARYYMQHLGRFTTVDPRHVGGSIFDPQSWNAYAYARNNPLRFIDPTGTDYFVNVDGGQSFWASDAEFDRLRGNPGAGISLLGGLVLAGGRIVGTYDYYSPFDRVLVDAARRAEPGVNAALALGAAQAGIVAGAASIAGLGGPMTTFGLQSEPILTNQLAGSIIGWGTGQAGAGLTRSLANNLTKAAVEQMKRQGLNKATVENLLRQYESAIAQGGKKLTNEQLLPRRELMKKILELW